MVKAIVEDSDTEMPVCAWMEGQYGIDGVYLGVIAKLGKEGISEIPEMDLTDPEKAALAAAAVAVADKVADLEELDH
jgi:malate dehydrogenase